MAPIMTMVEWLHRYATEFSAFDRSGSRAFHEHKDFAVSYVILREKLRISRRIDPYGGVWVARLDRSNSFTFVRNGDKRQFLQGRCATGVR
jgi:hypothetical protein